MRKVIFFLMIISVFILMSCNQTQSQSNETEKQNSKTNTQDVEIVYSLIPKQQMEITDRIREVFEEQFDKRMGIYKYKYSLKFQGENKDKAKVTIYDVKKDETEEMRKVLASNVADLKDNDVTQFSEEEREAIGYLISTDYPIQLEEEKVSIYNG